MEKNLRRPIVYIALAFSSGMAGQHQLNLNMAILIGLLAIEASTLFVFFHIYKRDNRNFLFVILMIMTMTIGGLWLSVADLKPSILSNHNNQHVTGQGTVVSVVKKDENIYKLVVRTNLILGSGVHEKTVVNYYGDFEKDRVFYDLPGRKIYFTGFVTLPDEMRNPNTFDYRYYLKTIGINTLIKCKQGDLEIDPKIEGKDNQIIHYLSMVKGEISKNFVLSIGEKRAGVISGMMWGEKDGIEGEVMEQFRMNGTAHILAVSGIHVGLVYLYLNKLFWRRKNIFSDSIIISLLFCYAAMANFSPSVMRAVIMIVIHIISKHIYCRYDFLCCGAVVITIMLIVNPFSLFNVGFQLSFLAIFSLAVILPFLQKIGSNFMNPILALQLGLAPMTAFVFNYFSLASLIANIPVIFLASLIIPLGLITIPLTIFDLPFLCFQSTAYGMRVLIDLMLTINDFVYNPGKSFLYVISPMLLFMMIYYFTLFFITSEGFQVLYARKKFEMIIKVMSFMMVTVIFLNIVIPNDFKKADIVFVDVGQGDCLHIKGEDGKNILFDGGGSINYDVGANVLMPYLLKNGVKKIDAAFVTHLHQDHYDGIATLAKKGFIKKLYIYEGNIIKEDIILEKTGLKKQQIGYLTAEDNVIINSDLSVQVLNPKQKTLEEYSNTDEKDENSSSLILRVNIKGFSVLMTGDIDIEGESRFIDDNKATACLETDILKISHHGSKYGTGDKILETLSPKVAVIQVGKNNFGHPQPSVVEKIKNKDIMLYRNDEKGAIGISLDEKRKNMRIVTMLE